MYDMQDYADNASNYKNHTYEKHANKKRGRSVSRKEKRVNCTETRITRDKLAASFAGREFRKEMKQFEKTVQEAVSRGINDIPMPEFLVDLRDTMRFHENNLKMAQISHEAMNRFPPLSRVA